MSLFTNENKNYFPNRLSRSVAIRSTVGAEIKIMVFLVQAGRLWAPWPRPPLSRPGVAPMKLSPPLCPIWLSESHPCLPCVTFQFPSVGQPAVPSVMLLRPHRPLLGDGGPPFWSQAGGTVSPQGAVKSPAPAYLVCIVFQVVF